MGDGLQIGGRLLAQGAYGCVFDPPLSCKGVKGLPHKGKVGKLSEETDLRAEILAAYLLQADPEAKKYLLLPQPATLCTPELDPAKQADKTIGECEPLKKAVRRGDKMFQYEMDNGGMAFRKYLDTKINIETFPYWAHAQQLLEIGAFLALHGVVHNDMHGGNLLIDDALVPRLTDFGRTYSHKSINKDLVDNLRGDYAPHLNQLPPEDSCKDGIEDGYSLPQILEDLRTKKAGLLMAERYLGVSRREQMAEFEKFWKTSKAAQSRDWVAFMKLYWPVFDAWSIGVNLMTVLRKMLMSKKFTESQDWKRRQGMFKEILRGLLRASPRSRIDCVEALAAFDPTNELVMSKAGQAWLAAREAQR
jgi:serine/threonine protein kinase